MAGLLDLFQNAFTGGGVLGQQPDAYAQAPMNILPGNTNPYPQGIDPTIYALRALQQPQQPGFIGALRGALDQFTDPQGARQQQAIQNYIHLRQLGIQEKSLEEKPQYIKVTKPDGTEGVMLIPPLGKEGARWINPTGEGSQPPNNPALPPGGNVKVFNEEMAKKAAANQEEAIKSAKAAADLQKDLDEAKAAYDEVVRLNAHGPLQANPYIGRPLDIGLATTGIDTAARKLFGSNAVGAKEAEAARQRYETAVAAVKAKVTAAQNRGEGAVSNYERQLYAAQFPQLTAIDPATQRPFWESLANENRRTIEAGKLSPLSQAPSVGGVLERAPITPGTQTPAPAMRVMNQTQYNALPSGSKYIAPDGSLRTKR